MNDTSNSVDLGSVAIGILLMFSCLPGLICNCILMWTMIKKGMLTSTSPVIYKYIMNLMVSDTYQLLLHMCYLGPASIAQQPLLPEHWTFLPGYSLLVNWYIMWLMLCALAVNRYIAICRQHEYTTIFNHRRANVFLILTWPIGILLSALAQFGFPCCRFTVSYVVYSYYYPDANRGINWSDYAIELPGNIGTALLVIYCYAALVLEVKRSNSKVHASLAEKEAQKRRQQETRLAFQFLAISVFFISAFVIFRILPATMPPNVTKPYAIISCINAFIYMKYNQALRAKMMESFCGNIATAATTVAPNPGIISLHEIGDVANSQPSTVSRKSIVQSVPHT